MNNSNAVITGRVTKPLQVKEVDVNGQKKSVGNMTVVAIRRSKSVKDANGKAKEFPTYYEVGTWSKAQQEELGKLNEGDNVLVRGQLIAESYEKDGNTGLNLKITDAEVSLLGSALVEDIQHVVVIGRVTRDPELKQTSNGQNVMRIPVALNHGGDKTSYVDIEAWDKQAETLSTMLSKGSLISAGGEISLDTFERKDQTKGAKLNIVKADIQAWDRKATQDKGAQSFKSSGSGSGSGAGAAR